MIELDRGTKISLNKNRTVLTDKTLVEGSIGVIAYSEYGPSGLEGYMIDFDNGKSWLVEPKDIKND